MRKINFYNLRVLKAGERKSVELSIFAGDSDNDPKMLKELYNYLISYSDDPDFENSLKKAIEEAKKDGEFNFSYDGKYYWLKKEEENV